jgi:NAD(P)-dependent dehydrogenase (short-subunit alcohol dehydrogenase family)
MSNNQLFNLVGKNTLITGATGGFGLALVEKFIANGQKVTALGRNQESLDRLSKIGATPAGVDLTNPGAVKEFSKNCDKFDNIILSHGIIGARPTRMLSPDFSLKVIEANLLSTLDLMSNILRAKKINSPGRIVFISSVAAHMGALNTVAYAASKAGGEAAMNGLARDLMHKEITVNSLAPAAIETALFLGHKSEVLDEKLYPLGIGQTSDVANAALFLCLEGSRYITGETIVLDGGATWLI